MYKTILLAYDGSLEGARALREGALLAKQCGAKVVLLSVVPTAAGVQMAEGVYGGAVAQQIEDHKDLLRRAVAWLKQRGFDPAARLACGEPAPLIGQLAKDIGADLVVVGHHHKNFFSRWWSGSTNAYLKDNVGCSLLIASNPISDEEFDAAVKQLGGPEPIS